jgi:catechol 2,3-dioxygenase-like lactoylglutathione lyase family enzyme
MSMRLNQVTLPSGDIGRSIDFYVRLGLEPIVKSPHYARFLLPEGGSTLSVHLADPVVPSTAVVYFECTDLDERVAALRASGFVFDSGPDDQPWLWREARLRDPDGNPLCLYYAGKNRLDPPWRVRPDDTGTGLPRPSPDPTAL